MPNLMNGINKTPAEKKKEAKDEQMQDFIQSELSKIPGDPNKMSIIEFAQLSKGQQKQLIKTWVGKKKTNLNARKAGMAAKVIEAQERIDAEILALDDLDKEF